MPAHCDGGSIDQDVWNHNEGGFKTPTTSSDIRHLQRPRGDTEKHKSTTQRPAIDREVSIITIYTIVENI